MVHIGHLLNSFSRLMHDIFRPSEIVQGDKEKPSSNYRQKGRGFRPNHFQA